MSAFETFEALGYRLGQRLASAKQPPPPVMSTVETMATKPGRTFQAGERVLYTEGREKHVAVVLRVSLDGRLVLQREPDGKRLLSPVEAVKRLRTR